MRTHNQPSSIWRPALSRIVDAAKPGLVLKHESRTKRPFVASQIFSSSALSVSFFNIFRFTAWQSDRRRDSMLHTARHTEPFGIQPLSWPYGIRGAKISSAFTGKDARDGDIVLRQLM